MSFPVDRVRSFSFHPLHDIPEHRPDGLPVHRLNLNESPWPPAPGVVRAMAEAAVRAHRYPDGEASELLARLAGMADWPVEQTFVGSGSNELLAASGEIALDPGDEVVAPVPAFPAYMKIARMRGADLRSVPVDDDGRIDVRAVLAAVTTRTRLVFVTSPHNPTGGVMSAAEIALLVQELPDHVMLHFDEAYYEFGRAAGGPEALPILRSRKGPWLSTRTFSKAYALAGARIGYGYASTPEIALGIRKVRPNFSLSLVSLAGAIAALDARPHYEAQIAATLSEAQRIAAALAPAGYSALPGAANFLALRVPDGSGDLVAQLRGRNIEIGGFEMSGRPVLRITIGTPEANDAVIEALRELAGR